MPRKGFFLSRYLKKMHERIRLRNNVLVSLRRAEDRLAETYARRRKWADTRRGLDIKFDPTEQKTFERHLRKDRRDAQEDVVDRISARNAAEKAVQHVQNQRKNAVVGTIRRLAAGPRANYRWWRMRKTAKKYTKKE